MRFRRPAPRHVLAALAVAAFLPALAGCSDDEASPPPTTTGIAATDPTTTTAPAPTTTEFDESQALPGLWVVGPTGIADESATQWVAAAPGETLRSPVSDGAGGLVYLRCVGDVVPCNLEDVEREGAEPSVVTTVDELFAVGTFREQRVAVVSRTDPSIVPSPTETRSPQSVELRDLDTGAVTPVAGWIDATSAPAAIAVSGDQLVACFGQGESCTVETGTSPEAMVPVPGPTAPSAVTSLVLDPTEGRALTWLDTVPMTGKVVIHMFDIAAGTPAGELVLSEESAPPPDDAVTDGTWVALRNGDKVVFSQVKFGATPELTGNTGTRTVPAETTEIAIRAEGGGGAGPSLTL